MNELTKGRSPFYPGQPVPLELFVGRSEQIDRVLVRGAGQVAHGKPVAVFVQGEYGIGKSSIANMTKALADRKFGLHGVYATLGGCRDIQDVTVNVLEAMVQSGALHENRGERIRNWLGKYIGDQSLFGLNLNLSALKHDAPSMSSPSSMLSFLREAMDRLGDAGVKGIFLILDEINGVASDATFCNFVKGLVDANATSGEPVPLLLMLCGVEERRREMIRKHQPIDRIFDVVDIGALTSSETEEFFTRAFISVQMTVSDDALKELSSYSAGFPKIMHLIGDAAYWFDRDGNVDLDDATEAVIQAAEEVGKKYVDQQVYNALHSKDYRAILSRIAAMGPNVMQFKKVDLAGQLTERQRSSLPNFLQRMKQLNVLRAGNVRGEYVFNMRMVRLYIWLRAMKDKR